MRTRGFTLVELLVVITIICLLAAILLPALVRARDRGRQAACMTNVRQVGMAIQLNADEHQEIYPGEIGATGLSTIWDKLKINKRAFMCPSSNLPIGYCYSGFVSGHSMSELSDPTLEVMIADGNGTVFTQPTDLDPRHSGGLVALFCDGHADFLTELPPMWIVHLKDPAEYEFEVEKSRYPVMLLFLNGDLPVAGEKVTPEESANQLLINTFKSVARTNRLQAKIVLVEVPDNEEKVLREDFFPPNYGDVQGKQNQSYPSVVILDRGGVKKTISPPQDQLGLKDQKLLDYWLQNVENYKNDVLTALEDVCKHARPWMEKE